MGKSFGVQINMWVNKKYTLTHKNKKNVTQKKLLTIELTHSRMVASHCNILMPSTAHTLIPIA
jgi:hypothetical protein